MPDGGAGGAAGWLEEELDDVVSALLVDAMLSLERDPTGCSLGPPAELVAGGELAGGGNGGNPLPWKPRELVVVALSRDLEPTGFPRDRDLEPSLSWDREPTGWSGPWSESSRVVLGCGDG